MGLAGGHLSKRPRPNRGGGARDGLHPTYGLGEDDGLDGGNGLDGDCDGVFLLSFASCVASLALCILMACLACFNHCFSRSSFSSLALCLLMTFLASFSSCFSCLSSFSSLRRTAARFCCCFVRAVLLDGPLVRVSVATDCPMLKGRRGAEGRGVGGGAGQGMYGMIGVTEQWIGIVWS